MAVADAHGLPIAIRTFGASTHDVKLAARTIQGAYVKPKRVIGDKAYDSDTLDERLRKKGVKMIAPYRQGRRRVATQDGRQLRRYCRRWKIERRFSWVFNYRRAVVRNEHHAKNYLGFVQLACIMILSRQLY
jgi:transposase